MCKLQFPVSVCAVLVVMVEFYVAKTAVTRLDQSLATTYGLVCSFASTVAVAQLWGTSGSDDLGLRAGTVAAFLLLVAATHLLTRTKKGSDKSSRGTLIG